MIPRRGAVALALTALALVLLLGFKTPTPPVVVGVTSPPAGGPASGATAVPGVTTAPGATAPVGAAPSPPRSTLPAGTGQFTGAVVDTDYGPVQVQVTVSGGKITDITALQLPSDRQRSAEISQYAAPILRSEALTAQSARIDTVSGATYTSQGYEQSLQSALDEIHG